MSSEIPRAPEQKDSRRWLDLYVKAKGLSAADTAALEAAAERDHDDVDKHVLIGGSPHARDREAHLHWLLLHRPAVSFGLGALSFAASFWRFRKTSRELLETRWGEALQRFGYESAVVENACGALLHLSPRFVEAVLKAGAQSTSNSSQAVLRWLRLESDFRLRRFEKAHTHETQEVLHVLARQAMKAHVDLLLRTDEVDRYLALRSCCAHLGDTRVVEVARAAERAHERALATNADPDDLRSCAAALLHLLNSDSASLIGALQHTFARTSPPLEDEEWRTLMARSVEELGIARVLRVVETSATGNAAAWLEWLRSRDG